MKKIMIILLLLSIYFLSAEYIEKERAISMLQEAQSEEYPESNEVYISNEIGVLDENCLGYEISENYRKILTDSARKDNIIQFWFDEDYGEKEVLNIELIKASGEIISFDPNEILQEKVNSFSGYSNIYSETSKILTAEIPNIEIGDIIYTKEKYIIIKQRMENNYFNSFGIDSYGKYLNDYFELTLQKNKNLYFHEINKKDFAYDFSKVEKGDNYVYSLNTQNNPLIIYEPGIEDYNFFAHHIKMTTVKDWEEISRWYYNIVKPHMETDQAIKDKVLELTEGLSSRQEKAAKLFYWTARNVRYLGVDKEKNRPGFEPHDVTYTFETRGGVCRDKAALLTAMLREAGIGSDVILISSGSRLNPEAPVLWFNHAITVAYDEKGEPEFVFDPTAENTKDFLPKYEEDNSYLIASEKGETLRLTPVSDPSKNNSTVNMNLNVDENYGVTGTLEYLFSGFSDTVIRSRFSRFDDYEFQNFIARSVSGLHPNTKLISFEYVDPDNKEEDIRIFAEIEIEDYISQFDENLFIPFEPSRLNLNMFYYYVMYPFKMSERKYDFKLGGAFSFDINYEIEFSDELASLSIPKLDFLDYEGFKTSLTQEHKGNNLKFQYHFENTKLHFKKEQFLEIKQKLANLSKYENLYIISEFGGEK